MHTQLKHLLFAAGIACFTLTAQAQPGTSQTKKTVQAVNPLMKPSTLPYNAPDFSKIKGDYYLPAIQAAIAAQRQEIKKITDNKQKPTFANTVLAYERSGQMLNRVTGIFFCVTEADKTPDLEKAEAAVIPMMTNFENEIKFNQKFFQRIKYVYDHELNQLKGEDKKLLEEVYKSFTHAGALLPKEKMARMQEINNRLAKLQQDFGNMLPKAANEATVWVSDVKELSGLSETDIAK